MFVCFLITTQQNTFRKHKVYLNNEQFLSIFSFSENRSNRQKTRIRNPSKKTRIQYHGFWNACPKDIDFFASLHKKPLQGNCTPNRYSRIVLMVKRRVQEGTSGDFLDLVKFIVQHVTVMLDRDGRK